MKCLCGYEHLYDYQTADNKAVGDEEFIMFNTFLYEDTEYYGVCKHRIYACPKCHTLKIEEE